MNRNTGSNTILSTEVSLLNLLVVGITVILLAIIGLALVM